MAEANRNFVVKKLQEWGFGDFIDNFHRKQIDQESFKLLDMDTIKILIPPAGPRLKFAKLLAEYKSSLEEVLFEMTIPIVSDAINNKNTCHIKIKFI